MSAGGSSAAVRFLYGTGMGRLMLRLMQRGRADRLVVAFLRSRLSKPVVHIYVRRHGLRLDKKQLRSFRSFRDFFARTRRNLLTDMHPEHLISPCDGWLSAFAIDEDSSFEIKGSRYRLRDLLVDEGLSRRYSGGDCLIYRLCPADYHHYCYIDDGYQGGNHYIPGELHSVQPAACARFPVYTLNRRCWTLLATENFGPVVQTAVGAFAVGGIVNERENARVRKGEEMGRFELAGSTIVQFFEKDRVRLLDEVRQHVERNGEFRVRQGMWVGLGAVEHES